MTDSVNLEPDDGELLDAFETAVASKGDDEVAEAQAIQRVQRAWQDGRLSKKSAYSYVAFGVVTDELERTLD